MEDDLIELSTICKKYFGITPLIARRRAALGTLPIPAFRLNESKKGPMFVHKSDLEKLIASRLAKAKETNDKMKLVGAAG